MGKYILLFFSMLIINSGFCMKRTTPDNESSTFQKCSKSSEGNPDSGLPKKVIAMYDPSTEKQAIEALITLSRAKTKHQKSEISSEVLKKAKLDSKEKKSLHKEMYKAFLPHTIAIPKSKLPTERITYCGKQFLVTIDPCAGDCFFSSILTSENIHALSRITSDASLSARLLARKAKREDISDEIKKFKLTLVKRLSTKKLLDNKITLHDPEKTKIPLIGLVDQLLEGFYPNERDIDETDSYDDAFEAIMNNSFTSEHEEQQTWHTATATIEKRLTNMLIGSDKPSENLSVFYNSLACLMTASLDFDVCINVLSKDKRLHREEKVDTVSFVNELNLHYTGKGTDIWLYLDQSTEMPHYYTTTQLD